MQNDIGITIEGMTSPKLKKVGQLVQKLLNDNRARVQTAWNALTGLILFRERSISGLLTRNDLFNFNTKSMESLIYNTLAAKLKRQVT
jgi:hypothetical protein